MQITQILNKIKLKLFKRRIDSDLNNNNKNKKVEMKIANETDSNKTRNDHGFPHDLVK
jgi:hypothetical protein